MAIRDRAASQESALLRPIDDQEIRAFHRDGAVLLPGMMSDAWLSVLESGLEHANKHPDGMSAGVAQPLRIDQFPASHSSDLQRFLDESPVAQIVGTILRAPVRFYMDQMFYKPAGRIAPSAWHQDTCYYNIEGQQLVRAWVCVDPAPREVSLEVVRGSHAWNVTYRPPVGLDPKDDPEAAAQIDAAHAAGEILIGREAHERWTYFDSFLDPNLPKLPQIEAQRESFEIIGWDIKPGDVLLFNGNILHSALGGVELPHPRRAHASLWAGPDVKYLRRRSQAIPDPLGLYDYSPSDGEELANFPEVFPLAWSPN